MNARDERVQFDAETRLQMYLNISNYPRFRNDSN